MKDRGDRRRKSEICYRRIEDHRRGSKSAVSTMVKVTRIVDFGAFVAIGGGKKVWFTSLKSRIACRK
ncbi:hypothetical protein KCP77_05010 [Salmonella enterica subsp. enterica]|nr:hypothetical protein KCP77_05010 [Salmonella enterica subsp. enterica]